MDSKPVATVNVHEHLRPKLCDLYENDSIFDKFQCCVNHDGSQVATGSYGNVFKSFNTAIGDEGESGGQFEVSKDPRGRLTPKTRGNGYHGGAGDIFNLPPADFRANKILHMAWHPKEDIIATAAANSLYFFSGGSP